MDRKHIFSPTLVYFCLSFNPYHLPFSTKLFTFLISCYIILFLFFKSFLSTCFLFSSISHCLSSETPEVTSSITHPQSVACCCSLTNYAAPAGNSTSYNILQKLKLSDTAVYRVLTTTNTAT